MKPKIWLYRNKETGESKGEATITYDDANAAQSAISWFDSKSFNGATIKVSLAQRTNTWQKPGGFRRGGPRGGGADGGGGRGGGGGGRGGFDRESGGGGGGRGGPQGKHIFVNCILVHRHGVKEGIRVKRNMPGS